MFDRRLQVQISTERSVSFPFDAEAMFTGSTSFCNAVGFSHRSPSRNTRVFAGSVTMETRAMLVSIER